MHADDVTRNLKNIFNQRWSQQCSHFSSGAAGKFGFSYPSAAMACDAGRNARPAACTFDIDSESHFLRVVPWSLIDNAREVVVKMEETIAIINNLRRDDPIRVQFGSTTQQQQTPTPEHGERESSE